MLVEIGSFPQKIGIISTTQFCPHSAECPLPVFASFSSCFWRSFGTSQARKYATTASDSISMVKKPMESLPPRRSNVSQPWKGPFQKEQLVFQPSIFRADVRFRGSIFNHIEPYSNIIQHNSILHHLQKNMKPIDIPKTKKKLPGTTIRYRSQRPTPAPMRPKGCIVRSPVASVKMLSHQVIQSPDLFYAAERLKVTNNHWFRVMFSLTIPKKDTSRIARRMRIDSLTFSIGDPNLNFRWCK